MIKEVKMYTVICDNCGVDSAEGSEFSCWNESEFAIDSAKESDWHETEDGEKHYCPDCYDFNDEDELIIEESITKAKEKEKI